VRDSPTIGKGSLRGADRRGVNLEKGDSSNSVESLDLTIVLDRRSIGCPLKSVILV
jgi:hypothetical protein